jgi:hypothetical protein
MNKGPFWSYALGTSGSFLTREPLNEGVLETVVDLALTGIAVERPSASQPTVCAPG